MVDGVFFISSALNVKQLSVFNNEERYLQTVETIKSIDKYCPNNVKYMFDTSYEEPNPEYIDTMQKMGVEFFYTGIHPSVKEFSDKGQRSLAETLGFAMILQHFKYNKVDCKRIYKMSGRYKLNDNFILNKEEFKDSFVFLPTVNSWMSKDIQELVGVDRIFELRLWHMDANLFDTFFVELPNIFQCMAQNNIDVEHSYYKYLNKYKWTTVEPIGLEGAIAPTGEIINE
jgi:hypothetical protein